MESTTERLHAPPPLDQLPPIPPPGSPTGPEGQLPAHNAGGASARRWPVAKILFAALCLAAFAVVAVVYFASLTNNLSVEGDNAVYIILAKAMAMGHGYMDIQNPVPRIEAQYPFIFPLMLVPIVKLFGVGGVLQMEALVTVFALGSFILGLFLFRRWLGSGVLALAVTLATAESDLVWEFAHKVLTEVPYLFFTLATCLLVTRYGAQNQWRTWAYVLTVLATSAAFLTRTIGVSLCVAVPLYLVFAPPLSLHDGGWKLRFQKALAVTAGLLILGGGWTLRNRIVYSGQGHNYLEQFMLKQAYVPDAGSVTGNGIAGLLERIGSNAHYYLDQYLRMVGGNFWDHIPDQSDVSLALLVATLAGCAYALIWRRTVAEFYVVGYVAIVLLWPWQDLRFAVPVMPFLFYYMATLIMLLPALLERFVRLIDARLVAATGMLALTFPSGVHTLHIAENDRNAGYHYQSNKLGEWVSYADWRDFHAAAMWLKAHARPESTVINRSPNIFYLWTGLDSRNYPYSTNTTYVMKDADMEGNDYFIYDDFTWTYTTALYMRPTLARFPDRFVALAHFHGTTVYRVLPAKAARPSPPRHSSRIGYNDSERLAP